MKIEKFIDMIYRMRFFIRKHFKEIIFGSYLCIALSVSAMGSTQSGSGHGTMMFFTLVLLTVFLLVPKIKNATESLSCARTFVSTHNVKHIFAAYSLLSFTCFLFWFTAYYPGAYSFDSINQYAQVIAGHYSDWHPVLHTLFSFTLPLTLTNTPASIGLFQIICFSLVLGMIASTVYTYCGKKWALVLMLPIIFSPWTLNIAMYPWKDVQFALASAMSMAIATKAFFGRELWSKSVANVLLLAFFFTLATVFRHNGVLFTLPLVATLLLYMPVKRWLLLIGTIIAAIILIRGPVYTILDVEKPGNRVLETMGFPLSVIAYVAKECPQCLDKETGNFIYALTKTEPKWKENLRLEGFNTIKWADGGVDYAIIENTGRWKIIKMMMHCLKDAPVQSAIAIGGLTSIVYGLEINCDNEPGIESNEFNIAYKGNNVMRNFSLFYSAAIKRTPIRFFLCTIGMPIIVMLAFILFRSHLTKGDVKKVLLCTPIFVYDFGTMLFLSGAESRFFYVNMLTYPLVVTIMLSKPIDKLRDLYV